MEAHHVQLGQRPDVVPLARAALGTSLDRMEFRDGEGRQWRDAVSMATAALEAALASLVDVSIEHPSVDDEDPWIDSETSYFIEFGQ